MTILTIHSYEPEHGREFTLWTSAALVVCALHVGLAATYLLLKPEPEARAEAPAFEVAFVPATTTPAPAVPETQQAVDEPPTPDQRSFDPPTEAPPPPQVPEPDPPPAQEETTVQPTPEPPPPVAEALVEPEPTPPPLALSIPEPPPEMKVPEEVAVLPPQVAVLPPPETKPAELAPPPPEKVLTPPPERTTRKPIPEEKVQKESRKPAPPKPAAAPGSRPARVAMAPNPGADNEGAREGRTSWQSELVAHIRRFATYNSQSNESGSVSISVTIDRNGRLKSRRLVSSSGSATLDRVAMELLDRAQPFPPFPASMTEAQVVRTVPLHLRPR